MQGFEYDLLRRRGYRRVFGMYSESNLAAQKAYAKFGYKPIGKVTHGYFMTFKYVRAKIPLRGIKIKADPLVFWRGAIKNGILKIRFRRPGAISAPVSTKPVSNALTGSGGRDV